MEIISDFKDYEVISTSNGCKYERWGNIKLKRPESSVIWPGEETEFDAEFIGSKNSGMWKTSGKVPNKWQISYHDMVFNLKLMGFKHTGLFPEQAYNWNLIRNKIKESKRKVKVLNLFAYTGAASIAALMEGAEVVHVDSSKGMIEWAKENVISNHLENAKIRFLVDDCIKFVKREIRRGNKYDIIIMDPPSFGRGAKNEIWQIEKDLYNLVKDCASLLSDDPLLFIINSYTSTLSITCTANILKKCLKSDKISATELGFNTKDGCILPCGGTAHFEK